MSAIDTGAHGYTDDDLRELVKHGATAVERHLAADLLNQRAVRKTWQQAYNEVKKCPSKDLLPV